MNHTTTIPQVLSTDTMIGDPVRNRAGEDLGKIEELMIDIHSGRINYAVLSFGGFLGLGNKLFAIPWPSLSLDTENKCFYLNVDKEVLKEAPGFDKDNWPNFADRKWGQTIYNYYGVNPYWN